MKKWIYLFIPLIVIGCGSKKVEMPAEHTASVVVMKKEVQESINLQTAKVEKRKIINYLEVFGTISQDTEDTVNVAPREKCIVKKVNVVLGQTVEAKSSIATLKTSAGEEELLAPSHGIVISQYIIEGEPADTLTPIITIANPDVMRASFDIYEKDIGKVELNQKASITTVAYPEKKFEGVIKFVSPRVDEITRTVKIRVDIENKEHFLKFGMSVNGKIEREAEIESLIVPRSAIQSLENKDHVFIVKDDTTFEAREVKTGLQTDKDSAIAEGLNENEVVVTQGSFVLKSELLKSELGDE